jgi:hypothetical protein
MTASTTLSRCPSMLLAIVLASTLILDLSGSAFVVSPVAHPILRSTTNHVVGFQPSALFSRSTDDDEKNEAPAVVKALIPSSDTTDVTLEETSSPASSSTPVTTFMITQEMKRVLVEELRYSRKDADAMRVELAGPIVEKRMKCPEQGMPDEWIDQSRALASRLENESKYPLKVPLLLVSAVLFGKGMSDAIVTLIKVNMDFPGASLMEEFMGVNVLGIDAVCVATGLALGVWTGKTMQDAGDK